MLWSLKTNCELYYCTLMYGLLVCIKYSHPLIAMYAVLATIVDDRKAIIVINIEAVEIN